MTTFEKLKLGDKFIVMPEKDEEKGAYNVFMKVTRRNQQSGYHNAVRLMDGIYSSMPLTMEVVTLNL